MKNMNVLLLILGQWVLHGSKIHTCPIHAQKFSSHDFGWMGPSLSKKWRLFRWSWTNGDFVKLYKCLKSSSDLGSLGTSWNYSSYMHEVSSHNFRCTGPAWNTWRLFCRFWVKGDFMKLVFIHAPSFFTWFWIDRAFMKNMKAFLPILDHWGLHEININ